MRLILRVTLSIEAAATSSHFSVRVLIENLICVVAVTRILHLFIFSPRSEWQSGRVVSFGEKLDAQIRHKQSTCHTRSFYARI